MTDEMTTLRSTLNILVLMTKTIKGDVDASVTVELEHDSAVIVARNQTHVARLAIPFDRLIEGRSPRDQAAFAIMAALDKLARA